MTRSPERPTTRSPSLFWRLWWRAISVERPQAALALGSLLVGAAVTAMLLNLYGDVRHKMTQEFRAYGANVVIAPASEGATAPDAGSTMDEASLAPLAEFVRRTPGVAAAPLLYGVVSVAREPADPRLPASESAEAVGADFGSLRRMNSGWRLSGEAVSADLPAGTCVLGEHLAARLNAHLGDAIGLRQVREVDHAGEPTPETFRIGIVLATGALEDDQVFIPLASLRRILGLGAKISLAELSIPGETRDVERSVHTLEGLLPGLQVRPIRQIVYSEGKVLGTIRWLLLSLTILILVIIALCVMATMTAIILERRKDIGVMKALGAGDALVVQLFMVEGAALGLAAGVAGFLVGAILARNLAQRLFGVELSVRWWTLPLVAGATVALAVLATQVPVRVVRSIQPTVVLKGE